MIVAELFAKLGLKPDKKSFKEGNRMLGIVKKAVIGLAAFKGVRYFQGLIKDTANAADEFAKMSKKVGISIEALQQLEFAAGISGTNLATLRVGLQRFARNASDADRGLKTARDAMKDAGVAWKDGEGGLRALDDMLMDVADRFKAMPNGTKKTALAMELFGRSGAELIPMLNEGREGIGKLREEFVDLGAQIDGETAKSFEEFNDDQLRVKTALKGIRNQAVMALLPQLKIMTKNMLAWVKANKDFIRQKTVQVFKVLVSLLKAFAKVVAFVVDHWKLLLTLLIGFKTLTGLLKLIALFKLVGLASMKAAIQTAAAWVAATLPFIILAALIAAIVVVVIELWQTFTGGKSILGDIKDAAVDMFVEWIGWADKYKDKWLSSLEAVRKQGALALNGIQEKAAEIFITSHLDELRALRKEEGRDLGQLPAQQLQQMIMARRIRIAGGGPAPTNTANTANTMNATINVQTSPGDDANAVAGKVQEAVANFWGMQMRGAAAATPGGG